MPFCSLKRLINNASNPPSGIVEGSFSHDIEVRRFGVNGSGVITYDEFGEPIDLNAQTNYISYILPCTIEMYDEENDEKSHVGGRPSKNEYMYFQVSLTADIIENDLVFYPPYSNNSYRVQKDRQMLSNGKRMIYAYYEVRSTK